MLRASWPYSLDSEHLRLQGWSSKDVMQLLGISTKDKKKLREPTLVDFLQFIDAVVEVHGDPFYELRYRCVVALAFTREPCSRVNRAKLPRRSSQVSIPLDRPGQ